MLYYKSIVNATHHLYKYKKMRKTNTLIAVIIMCTALFNSATAKQTYEGTFPTTGFGIGKSYGGLGGIRFQFRFGGIVGAGIHFGAGYFPNAPLGISAGLKFYAYKGLYLNAQFGTVGVQDEYSFSSTRTGMWQYSTKRESTGSSVVYGSSFLVGEDIMFGKKKNLGVNVAAGVAAPFDHTLTSVAIDLGFLIKF